MTVYVLYRYHDTPDNEGHDILGVYYDLSDARRDMLTGAATVKSYYPEDFWTDDMTWEDEMEIHLGHDPADISPATIHCWEIIGTTVT